MMKPAKGGENAACRARTYNLRFRRPMLYPIELKLRLPPSGRNGIKVRCSYVVSRRVVRAKKRGPLGAKGCPPDVQRAIRAGANAVSGFWFAVKLAAEAASPRGRRHDRRSWPATFTILLYRPMIRNVGAHWP